MENATTSAVYNTTWKLSGNINGPAIAFFVTLQLLLALPSNLFIVVHSLSHRKRFKQSAIILLFSLALSNLLMTLFYMPFVIVASGAQEWILGDSNYSRNILCQINGFTYEYSVIVTSHILVIISFDRFLFIVKAMGNRQIMTWKVTLAIMAAVWILPIFWCLSPYYGSGLGFYDWSPTDGGCLPFILLGGGLPVTVVYVVYVFILFSIIVITTVWTFVFTHGFLKKSLQLRHQGTHTSDVEKHIHLQKVRSLVGIFGALLIANSLSWIPYFISIFYTLIGDKLNKIPEEIDPTLFILSLSNNVTNPIIQIYFRRDLHDSLKQIFRIFKRKIVRYNGQRNSKKCIKGTRIQEKDNCVGSCDNESTVLSVNCKVPVEHLQTDINEQDDEMRSVEHSSDFNSSSTLPPVSVSVCLTCDSSECV